MLPPAACLEKFPEGESLEFGKRALLPQQIGTPASAGKALPPLLVDKYQDYKTCRNVYSILFCT